MLSTIISLLEVEGPAIVKAISDVMPSVISFFKGAGNRDAVLVAMDAAEAAYREAIDRELAAKWAPKS